jgi:hypothetical protein
MKLHFGQPSIAEPQRRQPAQREKAMERRVVTVTRLRDGTERPYPLGAAFDERPSIVDGPSSVARERFVLRRRDEGDAAVPGMTERS